MVHCRRYVFMQSWCSHCDRKKKGKQINRHSFLFPHFVFAVCSQPVFVLALVFANHLPPRCWFFIPLFVATRPSPRGPSAPSPVAAGCCSSSSERSWSIGACWDVMWSGKEPLFLETAVSCARVAEEWKREEDKKELFHLRSLRSSQSRILF